VPGKRASPERRLRGHGQEEVQGHQETVGPNPGYGQEEGLQDEAAAYPAPTSVAATTTLDQQHNSSTEDPDYPSPAQAFILEQEIIINATAATPNLLSSAEAFVADQHIITTGAAALLDQQPSTSLSPSEEAAAARRQAIKDLEARRRQISLHFRHSNLIRERNNRIKHNQWLKEANAKGPIVREDPDILWAKLMKLQEDRQPIPEGLWAQYQHSRREKEERDRKAAEEAANAEQEEEGAVGGAEPPQTTATTRRRSSSGSGGTSVFDRLGNNGGAVSKRRNTTDAPPLYSAALQGEGPFAGRLGPRETNPEEIPLPSDGEEDLEEDVLELLFQEEEEEDEGEK